MPEPDYDRIHDRELNRYIDSQFAESSEWTPEDTADFLEDFDDE